MANFILILLCLCAGVLLRIFHRMPIHAAKTLNSFVIHISLPALILVHMPALLGREDLGLNAFIPASMPWIQFALACVFFIPLSRIWGWSNGKTGALILTAGLGNTSFVGFPILEAFIGTDGVQIGVIVDQLGSFLTVSTVGLFVAAYYSGSSLTLLQVARRVVFFPPFLALLAAFAWYGTGTYGPGAALSLFDNLAITLVPIALVSVGLQLRVNLDILQRRWKDVLLGLVFKLFIAPGFLVLVYVYILQLPIDLVVLVTLLEGAMPPMITAAILVYEYELDTEIANLLVGVGIPVCLITLPFWFFILS